MCGFFQAAEPKEVSSEQFVCFYVCLKTHRSVTDSVVTGRILFKKRKTQAFILNGFAVDEVCGNTHWNKQD